MGVRCLFICHMPVFVWYLICVKVSCAAKDKNGNHPIKPAGFGRSQRLILQCSNVNRAIDGYNEFANVLDCS